MTQFATTTDDKSRMPADNPSDGSPIASGETQLVPPVTPPKTKRWPFGSERDERKQIEKDGSQSHNIRRLAAYGGVIFSGVLYLAGLGAIALVLGVVPGHDRVDSSSWHIVVAILVALFTVPTVLLIAILKVTSPSQAGDLPTSVHEALGKMFEKVVDKVIGKD
ncbi:hypothetical protein HWE04_00105 [Herbaspirillum sp. C7C2]|uniref:hypothetical protein n=1 Tax=Herbaspirillum sp. C7C2 TaxID=2736666 RepID=UPI001F522B76|nr:hypothetical protein [Herbaspirillum sp. C7C2]MCI1012240.1 hypothetical protein [Herbaspirillum sp. C7C2]